MSRDRVENRQYMREYRSRNRHAGEEPTDAAADMDLTSSVRLVQAELDSLPASKGLQSLVAAALAMARVLDDPAAVPQHPAAAGQLRQVMGEIRSARAPAAVSKLSMIRGGRSAG